ncbi:hypothetical protein GT039_21320 [Streptomyces sp. SID2955]|nr:hypothetical protein [Streptomyces sp. SID2955]
MSRWLARAAARAIVIEKRYEFIADAPEVTVGPVAVSAGYRSEERSTPDDGDASLLAVRTRGVRCRNLLGKVMSALDDGSSSGLEGLKRQLDTMEHRLVEIGEHIEEMGRRQERRNARELLFSILGLLRGFFFDIFKH